MPAAWAPAPSPCASTPVTTSPTAAVLPCGWPVPAKGGWHQRRPCARSTVPSPSLHPPASPASTPSRSMAIYSSRWIRAPCSMPASRSPRWWTRRASRCWMTATNSPARPPSLPPSRSCNGKTTPTTSTTGSLTATPVRPTAGSGLRIPNRHHPSNSATISKSNWRCHPTREAGE